MKLREPAGGERDGGNSAELSARARAEGGPVGNTPGTVRGPSRGSAIRLQRDPHLDGWGESVSTPPDQCAGA